MKVSRAALIEKRKGIAMRSISVDFISKNDIRISIDGEKITDVAGFSLEIKEGEVPSYSIQKNVFPKTKEIDKKETSLCSLWRTIPQAAKAFKEKDSKTAITDSLIRRLLAENKIKGKPKAEGSKVMMVDLNEIRSYFDSDSKTTKTAKLKPIY